MKDWLDNPNTSNSPIDRAFEVKDWLANWDKMWSRLSLGRGKKKRCGRTAMLPAMARPAFVETNPMESALVGESGNKIPALVSKLLLPLYERGLGDLYQRRFDY